MAKHTTDLFMGGLKFFRSMATKPWMRCLVCLAVGVALGVLGSILADNFFSNTSRRTVSISLPGGVEIDLEAIQKEMPFDSLYSRITVDRALRDALVERLADDHIYQMEDPRLGAALNEHLCTPIPDQPLTERIRLGKECAELPVARQLRRLADRRDVPFHYVGQKINIGTPDEKNQPKTGRAHACRNSDFRDRMVEITNPRTQVSIKVKATGNYDCTGFNMYPDIQLGAADAARLFVRPTDKYEEAVAVVLD